MQNSLQLIAGLIGVRLETPKPPPTSAPAAISAREATLEAARLAVCGDRELNYGSPEDNFQRIAYHWQCYLANKGPISAITPADVALMLALVKIARLQHQPNHPDSWVDIAGYAACGAEVSQKGDKK